ncbi:restriction endonuclease subunit S [Rhodanobacter sp. T12-5]|uniref:restriction endonuclease subunit S n=1 Tax=Rhodanobacter sp. T12-5 TaxID=2024611 RepID=UPI00156279F1|nr:restriction endonuclease subunit S [Rhodanobacter sp. T12-5]
MSLPRYAEYKDSGVAWLGEVPAHWEITPLKRLFQIVGGSTPKSDNSEFWDGDIVWVSPADLSKLDSLKITDSARKITSEGLASCATTLVPTGSLVLSTRAPIGSLAIADVELCTNQGCKSLVSTGASKSTFYAYMLLASTEQLNLRGKGTTFLELSADELGAFRAVRPQVDEQSAIVAFLDRETGKIDALIAEQEKLLTLLAEKRQATISHAVNRGLNPSAPMKDSGVPWLGEVPAHWKVLALRRLIDRFEQGWSPECEARPTDPGEWGVLKAGCVNGGEFDAQENKTLPLSLVPREELELKSGDVLMSRASGSPKLIGSVACVMNPPSHLMLSDKIFRIRLSADVDPRFFAVAMGSTPLRQQIEQAIGGAEGLANNLPQASIKDFWMSLPPVEEQLTIVDFLVCERAKLDDLAWTAERAIALLKERRSALIAAAVTGKIDVRQAA